MEKLTAAQQHCVKKMSDERLRLKLVAAGYEEDVVMAMERETMLSTYAEFLASGGVRPGAQAGYDPDVEAQKLAFEKQKWESEREDELRREEAQLRREEVEREERRVEREEKRLRERKNYEKKRLNYVEKRLREKLNYVKKRQNSVDGKLIE